MLACGREDKSKGADKSAAPSGADCAKAKAHGPLDWIEDDYQAAVSCARARNVPIVLDLWAPWCHTCISMQTTVFTDPSFAGLKDKFVFAALDTDRESNAAATAKFSNSAWPTFYVIDKNEAVLARFVGAASLEEFKVFLAAGQRAASGGAAAADARLLGAERALATRELETANEELTAALAAAPPAWPRRVEALGSLQLTLSKLGKVRECFELSEKHLDAVGRSAIATNFWETAASCAKKHATHEPERATKLIEGAVANLQKVLDDPTAPLSVDDRGEAFGYLRDELDHLERKDEARAVAERQRQLVDAGWSKATTPFARMTFLWPRAEVYAYLGRPLDVIPDFEKLATELPAEYEPLARIGWLYTKAGELDKAAAWTDKALALVYGPRKGRILTQRADIAKAAQDPMVELRFRTEAVKLWESLPPGQRNEDSLAKAKTALAEAEVATRAAQEAVHKGSSAGSAGSGSAR
jgi:thioredoxin-like negative regulator of GroEL